MRPVLPSRGVAKVKNVLSGDTVVLLGKASGPNAKAPEVVFTFERVTAPRMASKSNNNLDEPAAFPAREWLRSKCVGKNVSFETRKQGATAGDRVYGLLFFTNPADGTQSNLAVESVRNGFATPKVFGLDGDGKNSDDKADDDDAAAAIDDYERQLQSAFQEAKNNKVGMHSDVPLVRQLKNAGDDFQTLTLVEQTKKLCSKATLKVVIEYVFDGSRYRVQVTDDQLAPAGLKYGSFTLLLAGVSSPRPGNPRLNPPAESEPFAEEAKQFVELRLLHRELEVTLHGTDKSGACAVGTIHHPKGNIAVELLKNGLARMSDWSVRMMSPMDVPALRIAENGAKRTNTGVWHAYQPPQISGASQIIGTVVEVITGDTLSILPNGVPYDSEERLKKISLASVRSPRVGNERVGRADEPYSHECKDRLRVLTVGKNVKITVHYEREIPIGGKTEKRQFGTIAVGKREDIGQVLINEGLAVTQRHRDDDEKSPRYDELVAAEALAKAAKKGVHSEKEYAGRSPVDLMDPKKAKAYSGSLMRSGTVKAVVEFVFNGSRCKLLVPSENCNIMFAPANIRVPQPSPSPGSKAAGKPAEPFGDASKRHARLTLLQRTVEITCTGVTMGGVITGDIFVGTGAQRRDYSMELVGAGLATVDQRKIDYGEAPKSIIDAQLAAQKNKTGIWSIEPKVVEPKSTATAAPTKKAEGTSTIRLSEIRSGNHFFYHIVGDESTKVIEDSMKTFTANNGTDGAPIDAKVGKAVAALFDDGSGKSWYRAKIVEKPEGQKVKVLFLDHGNVATVPLATHLRPLDVTLGPDRIAPVAKEAELALTLVRPITDDEGIDAARMLQSLGWGQNLTARAFCEVEGKVQVALMTESDSSSSSTTTTINEQLIAAGLARVVKQQVVKSLATKVMGGNAVVKLAADLNVAQEAARKLRAGMWRYGDIGDEDDEEM